MAVSKEGKNAPAAKLCSGRVEEQAAAAFAEQVVRYGHGKRIFTQSHFLIFGPSKGN